MTTTTDRVACIHPECLDDLRRRVRTDRRTALRVVSLIEATLRDPFAGPGKPEPLKYYLRGCWSRRITQEHRLGYLGDDRGGQFLQARYHY